MARLLTVATVFAGHTNHQTITTNPRGQGPCVAPHGKWELGHFRPLRLALDRVILQVEGCFLFVCHLRYQIHFCNMHTEYRGSLYTIQVF